MEGFTIDDFFRALFFMIIASFGVFARLLNMRHKKAVTFSRVVSEICVVCFCSLMVYFVFSLVELPLEIGFVLAGMTGWIGPKLMERFIEKNTNIELREKKGRK